MRTRDVCPTTPAKLRGKVAVVDLHHIWTVGDLRNEIRRLKAKTTVLRRNLESGDDASFGMPSITDHHRAPIGFVSQKVFRMHWRRLEPKEPCSLDINPQSFVFHGWISQGRSPRSRVVSKEYCSEL
jgi:hypothetical protein